MKYDDASLDRALSALPLEEAPASLRSAILARTAYRPAPILSVAEIVAIASIAAVLSWIALTMGSQIGSAIAAAFSNLALLAWLAAGATAAVALEFLTLSQPLYAPQRRARDRAKP